MRFNPFRLKLASTEVLTDDARFVTMSHIYRGWCQQWFQAVTFQVCNTDPIGMGQVVAANLAVVRYRYRRAGLMWFPWLSQTRYWIAIHFDHLPHYTPTEVEMMPDEDPGNTFTRYMLQYQLNTK